jgi:deoxyribodipyrimidine photo-lyase
MKLTLVWLRRDLRLDDNTALQAALLEKANVLPLFIFDEHILDELPNDDPRVSFIYQNLQKINVKLKAYDSSILILKGKADAIWQHLTAEHEIESVYTNRDYEPYAMQRDANIEEFLTQKGIEFKTFKDQVVHEKNEVLKSDGTPYTVFTPYKNKWLEVYKPTKTSALHTTQNFIKLNFEFPKMESLGFIPSTIIVRDFNLTEVGQYAEQRNYPSLDATSYLGPHLRFGTISVRQVIAQLEPKDEVFLSELIWREFFMQILFHFPHVVTNNFRSKYDGIQWRNNVIEFDSWCKGETGYPMVDAGMKQLNETGYMHNRVRMVCAGFLCKHLLIDWRLGEAYFAKRLLDYELASNNGNWQWAAGTGCDAAPYFRIFNPIEQLKKFDKAGFYVKKWLPYYGTMNYPQPLVEHTQARSRALDVYKRGIEE